MSQSASPPAVAADDNAVTSTSILGECVLKLSHSTTYEPPLYLFPELLPQVPQGTPPLIVWDAVADAVDIAASSWRVADASVLLASGGAAATSSSAAAKDEAKGSASSAPHSPQAMVTLASMVAESRLLAVGLDASVLKNGSFSSFAIIQQLATLQTRMGLSDEEGAAMMSNHFINLLAWQKLREINGDSGPQAPVITGEGGGQDTEKTGAPSSSSPAASRKRTRAAEESEDTTAWLPSPDPWTSGAELARGASSTGEIFVSASESNVEERVDLLRTLASLYERPWRTLSSQGQQTDCVVPPGTVNVTSPFADNSKLPGSMLDPVEELGWGVPTALAATSADASLFFGRVRVALNRRFYSVVVSSSRTGSGGAAARRIPLNQLVTHFGREGGTQHAAAVAAAALVPIDAGLTAFTAHPELLSRLHFALVLRPVYDHTMQVPTSGENEIADVKGEGQDEADNEEGEAAEDDSTAPSRAFAVVHTKTPDHYTLWLANYGRNGVRIAGKGWVLGEPRELRAGDVLVLDDEVEVRIEEHATTAAACATDVETPTAHRAESPTPSQVKRERLEDD